MQLLSAVPLSRIRYSLLTTMIATSLALGLAGCPEDPDDATVQLPQPPPTDPTTPVEPTEPPAPVDVYTVASLFPTEGPTSGYTQVELYGQGLEEVVEVYFGESKALETLAITDSLVVALTPPRPRGLVDVTVVTAEGVSATLTAAFRFESDIQITDVIPSDGHMLGGEPVTVRGSGFTEDTTLVFDERQALQVEFVDDTTLVAITPQSDGTGFVDVHVAGSQGVGTLEDGFEYFVAPEIVQVLPAAGSVADAHRVDLVGAGFTSPMAISVDGRPASEVVVHDGGHVTATFPPGDEAGPVDVVVSTAYGTAVAAGGFTYIGLDQPDTLALWAAHPATGSIHGGTHVTLTVAGVTQAVGTTVLFGETAATILRVDPEHYTLQVAAPATETPGPVDISVSVGAQTVALADAFVYVAAPQVHEIQPNHGPLEGGTAVTITGRGFAPGAAVRIGALPAAQVEVIDETTLTAVTAPGSPGIANVTVLQNGVTDTLYGGFLYAGGLDVFVVSPSLGSQAGGTLVEIMGDGFGPDTQVSFGGTIAPWIIVESSTKLLVKTPPGTLGAVDVEVGSGGVSAVQPKGFTYYDPSSTPGTWGPSISRNVNVTVVDGFTRQPVPGAAVMLGEDASSPHKGMTDDNGQITFGGEDLVGQQTVTVSGSAYATAQIIGFDSENVAVAVDPELTCEQIEDLIPCDGPTGGQQAQVEGEVKAPFKGTFNPVGSCADETTAPGTLCLTCSGDLDCGDGQVCTELQDQGSVCTSPCQTDGDCPGGFACLPIAPEFTFQCVPSAGELRTYCDITEFGLDSQQAITWPGVLVGPDGQFDMPSRLGNFAVYCWSGLYKDGVFTPQKLGVLRNQGAFEDGEMVQTTIEMNHPIDTPIEIVLDRPDIGPAAPIGEESVGVRIALDLGSDGILDFPALQVKNREAIETVLPEKLSGNLSDARWVVIATVTNSFVPNAYSTTWERGLSDINSDRAFKLEAGVWNPVVGSAETVHSISNAGDSILGVGSNGQIIRSFANGYWALMQSGTKTDLYAVSATPDGPALAGGADGTLLAFDGITWSPMDSGVTTPVLGVLVRSASDGYAVTGDQILRQTGTSWAIEHTAGATLRGIAAGADGDVWAVGDAGTALRYTEGAWNEVPTPGQVSLRAVLTTSQGETWAVGAGGALLQLFDGAFAAIDSPTDAGLNAIWEADNGDLWVVGDRGTILRRDGEGTWFNDSPKGYRSNFLAVGGIGDGAWAMGSHELVMGPMMAIPENIRPSNGGVLGGAFSEMAWEARDTVDPHFNLVSFGGVLGPCTACGMTFVIPYEEWRTVANGNNDRAVFADLSSLTGKSFLEAGTKPVTITRAYMDSDGFDFDEAGGDEFTSSYLWRSWAGNETTVFKN